MPPRPSAMGGAQIIVILVPKKGDNEEAVKLLAARGESQYRKYVPSGIVSGKMSLLSGERRRWRWADGRKSDRVRCGSK